VGLGLVWVYVSLVLRLRSPAIFGWVAGSWGLVHSPPDGLPRGVQQLRVFSSQLACAVEQAELGAPRECFEGDPSKVVGCEGRGAGACSRVTCRDILDIQAGREEGLSVEEMRIRAMKLHTRSVRGALPWGQWEQASLLLRRDCTGYPVVVQEPPFPLWCGLL